MSWRISPTAIVPSRWFPCWRKGLTGRIPNATTWQGSCLTCLNTTTIANTRTMLRIIISIVRNRHAMSGRRFSLCKRTVMLRDGRFSTATSIPPVRRPSVMQNKPMWASPSRPIRSKSGCWPISSVAHNRFSILSARLTTRKSAAVRLPLVMEIATERIASEAD